MPRGVWNISIQKGGTQNDEVQEEFFWHAFPPGCGGKRECQNSQERGKLQTVSKSDAALSPQCRKKGVLILPDIILPYEPIVITDTTDLPRDEWLAYRKTGIGGSDVAAILGISPFGTARDIYYDKLSIASFYDDEANKYQKKIGTLLEDVVAEMFA